MKVVNAYWEVENIGKVTVEITLDKNDLLKAPRDIVNYVTETKERYKSEYTVIKIPSGNPMTGVEFSKNGFFHIETQLNLKAVREDVEASLENYGNLFTDVEIEFVTDLKELENIQTELIKGIFTKDRISLDPNFDKSLAGKRYSNWVKNEFERGAQVFYAKLTGRKIGFSLWRYHKSSAFAVLSGLFNEYRYSNLGGNIYFVAIKNALQKGSRNFYTSVSSNNLESLRLHELTGFRINSLYEVYVHHER